MCFFGPVTSIWFFCTFLKMRQIISTLPALLFQYVASITLFLPKVEKLNISAIYKSIVIFFQWIFPQENLENIFYVGEVLQGRSKSKFNIILSYSLVLFFFWFRYYPIYLETKKILFLNFLLQCSKISQFETFKLPGVLVLTAKTINYYSKEKILNDMIQIFLS